MRWTRALALLLTDVAAAMSAVIVIVFETLHALGLYESNWVHSHSDAILLFLVSFLVASNVLDRRVTEEAHQRAILDKIASLGAESGAYQAEKAGLRNFYTSRSDYATKRLAPQLKDYLERARNTIDIVAYWMAHGGEIEGISADIGKLIREKPHLVVRIGIIDPHSAYIPGISEYLGISTADVKSRVSASISEISKTRDGLPKKDRSRLLLYSYDKIPICSTIILDGKDVGGVAQLDFKMYQAPRQQTLGLEIGHSPSGVLERIIRTTDQFFLSSTPLP